MPFTSRKQIVQADGEIEDIPEREFEIPNALEEDHLHPPA
jgi:hypothetical protein